MLLDGKKVAQEIKTRLKEEVSVLSQKHSVVPVLACLCACENPAVSVYAKAQGMIARELGIEYRCVSLKNDATEAGAIFEAGKLNQDKTVHAIIVQTPLPNKISMDSLINAISASKDAEGLHPENLGKLLIGKNSIAPCTALACMELLRAYNIELRGKEVVIIGHSNIVGKPLSLMMLKEFATTTVCHIATSETKNLEGHVGRADILIVAVGKPNLIPGEWVKEGAVVVDVGINKVGAVLVGDVVFEEAQKRASYITPVPGGVGPLTVAILMKNCVELFKDSIRNS